MLLALKEMICSEIMANLTSLILKKTVNIKKVINPIHAIKNTK